MEILRTPDARFDGLPDYPFAPHYVEVPGPEGTRLRMHAIDEGPRDAPVILMLHGEPTWSFLYRKMIPVLVAAGLRAVAPDHIGFGRSDKLADRTAYSYASYVDWTQALVVALDLRGVTLVCQDWGGPIGLSTLAAEPERFARVVAANTILPTVDPELTQGILEWRTDALLDWILASQRMPHFSAGAIIAGVCQRPVAPEVVAAYDAPFPDERHLAAARHFPALIPITPGDPGAERNRATWRVLERFERPFLTAYSDGDPATRGWETIFQRRIPGARGQPHTTIANAGHFLQEDAGAELAKVVVDFVARG
ncbi:MAG: alpha/beta fold hydrolase [Myxococcales bacterium]|nr:MAG: alpha/beta fold hydrolase [Myxococcales bacterium]